METIKKLMEKYQKQLIGAIGSFIVFLLVMVGCSTINKKLGLHDDNLAEEAAEFIVKEKFGIDVDFTPDSCEDSK